MVARFDGLVAKYMGNGVLVYFGYPQAHEDAANRAVRAGLALIKAMAKPRIKEPVQVVSTLRPAWSRSATSSAPRRRRNRALWAKRRTWRRARRGLRHRIWLSSLSDSTASRQSL